jgi:hypothetical protein
MNEGTYVKNNKVSPLPKINLDGAEAQDLGRFDRLFDQETGVVNVGLQKKVDNENNATISGVFGPLIDRDFPPFDLSFSSWRL